MFRIAEYLADKLQSLDREKRESSFLENQCFKYCQKFLVVTISVL